MELFFSAIALLLIFEGLPYFINPEGMKNATKIMLEASPSTLRGGGLALMLTGLFILYLIRN